MSEKVATKGNTELTERIIKWLVLISTLLGILIALGGAVIVLNTNAADIRALKVEQARLELEIAEVASRHEIEMTKLEVRFESAMSDMNPVLLDIQSRMVRIETQLTMVLGQQVGP